jgi:hypothetical protein
MPTLKERLESLIEQGASAEEIARIARRMATQETKDHFLSALQLPDSDERCIAATVTDWDCVRAFFAKQPTDQYHPQRIFRDIQQDIRDAVEAEDAQALVLALMLHAKAVQA